LVRDRLLGLGELLKPERFGRREGGGPIGVGAEGICGIAAEAIPAA